MGTIISTRRVATAEAVQLRAELATVRRELVSTRLLIRGVDRRHRDLVHARPEAERPLRRGLPHGDDGAVVNNTALIPANPANG